METVDCVLCHVNDVEHILDLRDFAFNEPGGFSLVRCCRCGLLYLNPRPRPSEIHRYYPDSYTPYKLAIDDERWALMRWARRRNIRRYCRVIERFSSHAPGRVLDIGCSTGLFLAEMRDAGWETRGIETNLGAVAYAQERFGLQVVAGPLSDSEFSPAQFTAVTLWDVLEHTYNPLETLQQVHSLLDKDGIVALSLPHYESWDRLIFGKYWVGYDAPRHLYVFPREVLFRFLAEAGFKVVSVQCALGGYHTSVASLQLQLNQSVRSSFARKMWSRVTNIPGMRFVFWPWDFLADRMDRGNKLVLIARKDTVQPR